MQWLDPNQIIEYQADVHMRDLYYDRFPKDQKKFIDSEIKSEFHLNPDSIRASPDLLKIYEDSVLAHIKKRYIKNNQEYYAKYKKDVLPESGVLYRLTGIAYPEVYTKIKDWWYQRGYHMDDFFFHLLRMNDPQAQSVIDKITTQFVRSNGDTCLYGFNQYNYIHMFERIHNAY